MGIVNYDYVEEWMTDTEGYVSICRKGCWISDYGAKVVDQEVIEFLDFGTPGQSFEHSLYVLEIVA